MVADLDDAGVAVLGAVPAGPPTLTWPVIEWTTWLALIPSAIALTLVTTAEGLLVSRSYGEKRGYPTRPNRDLFAFGLGNIAAGASGGFAIGSSTSRTAAMDQAGSRTQLPSLVLAAGTLLLLLFGTALLADIPSPAIGAIVAMAILPLLGIREFRAVAARPLRVPHRGGLLPRHALRRLDPRHPRRLRARPDQPRQAGREPGDRRARHERLPRPTRSSATPPSDRRRRPASSSSAWPRRCSSPTAMSSAHAVKRAVRDGARCSVHDLVVDMEAVTDVDVTAAESFAACKRMAAPRRASRCRSAACGRRAERLTTFGILQSETVFATNRAAIDALAPPVSWRDKLREKLFGHATTPEHGEAPVPGPPTDTIHITRSSTYDRSTMGQVIGDILPLAIGVAISPIPIIAAILMLLSPKAKGTSVGFLLGWVAGIVVAVTLFTLLSSVIPATDDTAAKPVQGVIPLLLGAGLLLLALRQWRTRPAPGEQAALPKWMSAIDTMTAGKGFGLGFLLAAVNPKNLLMGAAAGLAIGGAGLDVGADVVAILVFTLVAACSVAVPVIAYLVASQRMGGPLESLRSWLVQNNATVMAVLLLVIGVVLIGKGIASF